jgi:hypothetical protein
MGGNEDCVLALVDSIYSNIARMNKVEFLIALDSVSSNSDGEVAEYLMDVGVKLFYDQMPLLTKYLMNINPKRPGSMGRLIFESMSSYIETSNDPEKKRMKVMTYVDKQRSANKIDGTEYNYLTKFVKRLDPNLFK